MRNLPLARRPAPPAPPATGSPDDDAWLVRDAKRDPRAFAPLYDRYFDLVYRYCFRRLGHPEAAADATSQVFAKVLAALPRYRDDAPSFRSWLFTIAHNVIVDEARAYHATTTLDAAAWIADASPSPEDEMLTAEEGRTIQALLAYVTPDQRQILELRLAGLTGPEIAVTLGRTLGSIKVAQARAFARMRSAHSMVANPGEEATNAAR